MADNTATITCPCSRADATALEWYLDRLVEEIEGAA